MSDNTTALYIRLSDDDGGAKESNSVTNQRDLLNAYAASHPELCKTRIVEFSDDGWSGTNFERPGVSDMLEKVRSGGIASIVVKDLSRFGRNYIEVCKYLDQIFPFLGVRFISVNDHYDSQEHIGRTAPLDVAFSSMLNNLYSKDLSRKVKQSYATKAARGEFLCGVAPFGYSRSETERNKLVVDEDAAVTVRKIFGLAAEGHKTTEIAAILNRDGVYTPLMYRREKGYTLRGNKSAVRENNLWLDKNVRRILTDERYTGVQVSGKTTKKCVGSLNFVALPESEWIKAPGAHEAIISPELFARVQAGIARWQKKGKDKRRSLFAGKTKCGHCGHALDYADCKEPYYICYDGRLTEAARCWDGRLYIGDLKEYVLSAIKTEAKKALTSKQRFMRDALQKARSAKNALAEIKKLNLQSEQAQRRLFVLYEDFTDGKIDAEKYAALKSGISKELKQAKAMIEELNRRLDGAETHASADDISLLQRIIDASEVTEEIVGMIDRVVVYDAEHIEISFTFRDMV